MLRFKELFNAVGAELVNVAITQGQAVNVSALAKGFYIYRFSSDKGKIFEGKIVIQ